MIMLLYTQTFKFWLTIYSDSLIKVLASETFRDVGYITMGCIERLSFLINKVGGRNSYLNLEIFILLRIQNTYISENLFSVGILWKPISLTMCSDALCNYHSGPNKPESRAGTLAWL
jgi:hypothetical protein